MMSKVKRKETLSAYMKRSREASGLSQQEVGRKIGLSSPQFISNWERGISGPPVKTLLRLKNIYKLDLNHVVDLIVDGTRVKLHRAFGLKN
jgi:transcriptional regulator with XRE-family HTH domain